MSIISDIKKSLARLEQSKKDLRKFGFVMFFAFSILGGLVYFFGSQPRRGLFLVLLGLFFLTMAILFPTSLQRTHTGWMALAFFLGWFVSRIILIILFFIVITPIGILMRILGKDILNKIIDQSRKSYWIKRQQKPTEQVNYERPF